MIHKIMYKTVVIICEDGYEIRRSKQVRDKNWMKFEASGRVDDYLAYCRNSQNRYGTSVDDRNSNRNNRYDRNHGYDRNEDEDVDESECYPDRDGFEFHARG